MPRKRREGFGLKNNENTMYFRMRARSASQPVDGTREKALTVLPELVYRIYERIGKGGWAPLLTKVGTRYQSSKRKKKRRNCQSQTKGSTIRFIDVEI